MELNRIIDHADERTCRAALRQNVLQYGRLLGWPARSAIAFVERATGRPWKRCTSEQLANLVDELATMHRLAELESTEPLVQSNDARARSRNRGHRS